MDIEHHAEELASDLGVDKAEVARDLENLLEYSVPVDEAVQSLRRKYGDGGGDTDTPTQAAIGDITVEDSSVSVTGTVLAAGKRSIRYDGQDQEILEGEIADDSGVIDFTAWEEFDLEPGVTVTIGNAGVREWDGEPQLNLGSRTSVTSAEEHLTVPYEVGGEVALAEVRTGDRARTVEVVVLECERRTIDGRDGETEIQSGVFGDESGRLPFTCWDPNPAIEEGATLRLENVSVREFRGVPEVNVSTYTVVEPLERSIAVGEDTPELSIREAVETGGIYDVELVGNVIAVRDGSGLIQRCPECRRVVQKGQCRTHGEVDAVDDLRVKAILDDGSGAVTVILDDELTASVYGGGLEDAREEAREAMDHGVVAETIRDQIVGREYRVRGHLSVDDFGANLDASTFEESGDDPTDRATTFLAEVGQ